MSEVVRQLQSSGVAIVQGPLRATGAKSQLSSIYIHDPDENLIDVSSKVVTLAGDPGAPLLGTDRIPS